MVNQTFKQIRVHPKAPGLTADYVAVANLKLISSPQSYYRAQRLLFATAKYIKKFGLFSTEKSRLEKVKSKFYLLYKALKEDKFMEEKGEFAVIEYLSLFSDAFPNWQKEYEALNEITPTLHYYCIKREVLDS